VHSIAGVGEQVEQHSAQVLGNHLHRQRAVNKLAQLDIERREPGAVAVIGQVEVLEGHGVEVDDPALILGAAGVIHHIAHDAVRSLTAVADVDGILPQLLDQLDQILEVCWLQAVPLLFECLDEVVGETHRALGKVGDEVEGVLNLVGDAGCDLTEGGHLLLQDELVLGFEDLRILAPELCGNGSDLLALPVELLRDDRDEYRDREEN